MVKRVAVIGAGSWGTTVATMVCRNASTILWARRKDLADEIASDHQSRAYLPGFQLPLQLEATSSLEEAVSGADVLVMGVPSHGFRQVLSEAAPFIGAGVPVISLSKGVEQESLKRMTEVVGEVLGGGDGDKAAATGAPSHPAGVLTGPNLAKEIMAGYPAASVVAMADEAVATELQALFATEWFRVYTNPDVIGCEVAGALKNVMAIAAGMVDGMGLGDNTKAALMTRGLAELARLGVKLGGRPLTFSGLAGMGDLIATCSSKQSRNRFVGEQLAKGLSMQEIIDDMNMVAEGVKSSKAVVDLAHRVGVEMPIAEQVVAALYEGKPAGDTIAALMTRQHKPELDGLA
jgi:glycerol-3-phosphate dehydrogenase (NAD(P)+)